MSEAPRLLRQAFLIEVEVPAGHEPRIALQTTFDLASALQDAARYRIVGPTTEVEVIR